MPEALQIALLSGSFALAGTLFGGFITWKAAVHLERRRWAREDERSVIHERKQVYEDMIQLLNEIEFGLRTEEERLSRLAQIRARADIWASSAVYQQSNIVFVLRTILEANPDLRAPALFDEREELIRLMRNEIGVTKLESSASRL